MNENPHLKQGMLWLERNRPERAEPDLRKAVAFDPEDAGCRARLALCLVELEKYREGIREAQEAVGLEPDWVFPHYVRALALLGMGKTKPAEAALREVIELDPEEALYRGALSSVLGRQKRWKEALKAAEEGLELDPEDESCASARAMALVQLGRASEADLAMESALRKDPEDAEVHALMGWSMLHKGKAREAIDHYHEALKLDPTSETARAGLVESLKARNFLYRAVLRYFLLLTRIKTRWIIAIMVGSIILRRSLASLAESVPALAPVAMPIFYLLVGFILMTWVAIPLFNLLLRFDRVGRHALSRKDIRQTNWLIGNLLVVAFFIALWLCGVHGMAMAAAFSAMLIIPVTTTLGCDNIRAILILGGYTLALAIVGAYGVYLLNDYDNYLDSLTQAGLSDSDSGIISFEKIEDMSKEEQRKAIPLFTEWMEKRKEQRETTESFVLYFVIGWVAFTWLSGFVSARYDRE